MSEQTSSKAAGKRYGLAVRLLGLLCIMLACSSALAIGLFGAGMLSGFVLASAMGGLVVPALLAATDPLDALLAVLQLIWESVATLLARIFHEGTSRGHRDVVVVRRTDCLTVKA